MKKTIKILLTLTIVGSLFAVGFAGNAAADSQESDQVAVSHVDQDQGVLQYNRNYQDDNVAFSGAFSANPRNAPANDLVDGGDSGAESGDAVAIQASAQSNENSQFAYSNAENENEQEVED
ncbi:hypothetical protein [Haladaptatus sp. CMAA 1911]|uniref:hypothetical protein n=1 Tax=unclassified Haladaptatus TaxID=2622732 RepID=UPI0037540D0F